MFSGFGGGGLVNIPQRFEAFFRCYPVAMMNDRIRKDDANYGGKIFLPPSALNKLTMLNIRYPMLFELTASESGRTTHAGVLEFIAEEGRAYLPQWMLETLQIQPGSLLTIASTDIPLGNFVKIEPQSTDFLDISDPKAVLENVLRNFSTLTVDDIIEISYNNKFYRIKVLEVKPESPSKGICVIETDLVTDFAPPVGYEEPDYKALKEQQARDNSRLNTSSHSKGTMSKRIEYGEILSEAKDTKKSFAFGGVKLSGKPTKPKSTEDIYDNLSLEGEPARLDLPDGQLFFGFPIVLPSTSQDQTADSNKNTTFIGQGQSLRKSNKRKGKGNHEQGKAKAPRSPEVIEID